MADTRYTKNGEITYDKLSKEYTVWDETYASTVCVTPYPIVAEQALRVYAKEYLDVENLNLEYVGE